MTGHNLQSQAESLEPQEWEQLETANRFQDIALTRAEHDAIVDAEGGAGFWGTSGPDSVFDAWNSAAFDASENRMFFMGGGHADYGGNEVYQFDFDTLTWSRVSDPDPLTKQDGTDKNGDPLFVPEDGPLSPHTYEGLTWNPTTNTLWLTNTDTGFSSTLGSPNAPPADAVWEFDPSTGEWTSHAIESSNNRGSSAFIPGTDQVLAIENSNRGRFDPTLIDAGGGASHGAATEFDALPGMGSGRIEGNLFRSPETDQLYQSRKKGIFKLDLVKDQDGNIIDFHDQKIAGSPADLHQAGFDYRTADGNFYAWNGDREVIRWDPGDPNDPSDDTFETLFNVGGDIPTGSGDGRVFNKFVYLDEADAFAGIINAEGEDGGLWLYKPGDNPDNINKFDTDLGAVQLDPATDHAINLHIPGGELDVNENGRVEVSYREAGSGNAWQGAQDLLHQADGDFAGSVLGLQPGTAYDVKLTASDPDGIAAGTDGETIITASTSDVPPDTANAGGEIRVASLAELENAVDQATGGETIVLEGGTYDGSIDIKNGGTADAPITIRGEGDGQTLIDGQGAGQALRLEADHVTVENFRIRNADKGIALRDGRGDHVDGATIRGNELTEVRRGIDANEGHRDLTITDNLLIGENAFGNTSSETWGDEGIVVTGQGIEVAHNTIAGFGDSLGLNKNTDLANRGIDFHHNKVLWGGDDGVELDFADRNVQAHDNLLMNTANGVSFQFVDEGPAVAYRNVMFNLERGPYKIKPEATTNEGIRLFNNTTIKSGEAWKDFSGGPENVKVLNNLFVGDGTTADTVRADTTNFRDAEFDHNAWSHDGRFQVGGIGSFNSFQDWKTNGPRGNNDVLLDGERIFSALPRDESAKGFDVFRTAPEGGFTLAEGSSAIDAGTEIPGVTDGFTGEAPDIGAVETGGDPTSYGSRVHTDLAVILENDIVREVATGPVTLNVVANDLSLSGSPIEVTRIEQPESGQVQINDDETLTFTPDADSFGITQFSYFADDGSGGEVSAEVTVPVLGSDAALPGDPVTFDPATVESYTADQDGDGSATVSADGDTITLEGNAWKQVAVDYEATSNTRLSFEARVDSEGEIQGIGVDRDSAWDNGNDVAFIVAGTQTDVASRASLNYDFHNEGETGWKTFVIDLGSSFTGSVGNLTFISDHDVDNADASAAYRNVRLFESDGTVNTGTTDGGSSNEDTTEDTSSATGDAPEAEVTADGSLAFRPETFSAYTDEQDEGGSVSVSGDGSTVSLNGNTWKAAAFNYDVTSETVLRFDARIDSEGEIQGIGVDADGVWDNGNDVAFVLGGTQTDALSRASLNDDFRGRAGDEWQTFEIDLGSHFTGSIANLTFLNDHDVSNPTAAASFRDIQVFEKSQEEPNTPPEAQDDRASVLNDGSVTIPILDNDSDPDGDTLSVASLGEAAHGRVAANDDGTVTFTPDDGFVGTDSFTYTASDGNGGETTGGVTVEVAAPNRAPEVQDDSASVLNDARVTIPILENDSDPDGDSLAVASVGEAAHGRVTANDDGTVTFTPDDGFVGTDSFSYTAGDGNGGDTTGGVTVEVAAPNRAPEVQDDSASVLNDGSVTIPILDNDSDPDGDTLSVASLGEAAHGRVAANDDGTVTFTPDDGFVGTDSFTYTADDGNGGEATGQVSVSVNSPHITPTIGHDAGDFRSYGDGNQQDVDGGVTIADDGDTVGLTGNTWKQLAFEHDVTANTILRFDARIDTEGEIQGIGVDGDGTWGNGNDLAFVLAGTQDNVRSRSELNYDRQGEIGETWQTFEIDLGAHYTGAAENLTFINDHDVDKPDAQASFRNIRLFDEDSGGEASPVDNLSSYSGAGAEQDVDGTASFDADGQGLTLSGNTWKKKAIDHDVTADTVLRFEARLGAEGEIQGIGVDGDGTWGNGNDLAFVLAGTQDDVRSRAELNYDRHGEINETWQTFEIDLGAHYSGPAENLTFINDHDVEAPDAEVSFRDIEFLDGTSGDVDVVI